MTQQLKRAISMSMLVAALALVTAVAPVYGQSSRSTRANVPFDFVVGNTSFSSGVYQIGAISGTGETLRVTNVSSQKSIYQLSTSLGAPSSKESKLVFHRYGSQYFLAEVWGNDRGRQITKSKSETAAEHEIADIRARGGQAPSYERVEVLAMVR